MKKSIWWALQCAFWYRWDYDIPLIARYFHATAWWHAMTLRDTYNTEPQLSDEGCQSDTPRQAVAIDVSYWEE